MALGIAGVVAAENWDAQQQAAAALDDLMHRHELLAVALGTPLRTGASAREGGSKAIEILCADARLVEQRADVVVLFRRQGTAALRSCRGEAAHLPRLELTLQSGAGGIVLTREEAVELGLPKRIAVAGFAKAPEGTELVVVGSAATYRDRSQRQQARALISMGVVSALILGFGLVFLRQQKRQSALEQQVEIERAQQERDAELAKANRMATLAAMASGFAHEIGTPLGVIAGRVEQLRTGEFEPRQRAELLAKVTLQIERIDRLIRTFLGFARGEAPLFSDATAGEIAENAVRLVRHRFASEGVQLELQLGSAANSPIACEPALFEQVIVNVLINALEASSSRQTVTLRLEHRVGGVTFSVLDQGEGIPASVAARVTEPFFTTKSRSGGSGLGLTIAREIVTHHRGELSIRRRDEGGAPATGTEVSVRVPCRGEA